MRNTILIASILPAIALASCNSAATGDSAPTASASTAEQAMVPAGDPVELAENSPFAATSHGTFAEPWALAFEPGTGTIFITEKAGTMKFYDPATGHTGTVTGTPEVAYGGQGGFGEVAFAPDYETSRHIYLSWAKGTPGQATRAVVGRGTLVCEGDSCRIDGLTEIWQQSRDGARPGHYSHRIAFSPDGQHLFISSGDRMEQDPAQDLSNNYGAVIRLNLDGTPAAGNPFADQGSPADQIWSYGHRNLLGLAFDPNGQLWDIEHGPAGGDELNRVDRGANYGWPVRSNGDNYSGVDIPDHTADDGFSKPAISWNPVIAPGSMIFYTGSMFADWQGNALVANLGTMSISRIAANASANTASEEARYEFPKRLRAIAQAPDGALWVIEDGADGRLMRLTPAG
ncbi:PQQ-dependent sugar dehydrogenase [Aurantiacibacter sp. MUD11]|uniref:PQQ-dependent sugar dehydrogenase n=1 Tax=Aurantiacibacter sp. MUD11 TaxID=3003265 RepID=UPI0022AA3184|nr:PQQ-dependent sugar dehydrogenase [Aurantiacibacter sp. MUD11]WAT18785.1 PQQ-dependent sugar dehydrogenase [Aurantiacibacter sp. MUD11]